jgi:arginine decarboxylase
VERLIATEEKLTKVYLIPGLPMPTKFSLVGAASEGRTELTAFDRALLLSGVGNVNLLKVSSILPPGAVYQEKVDIQPGILLPIAYGSLVSTEEGRVISASVAVGISSSENYGVIMEFSGYCSKAEAEERVLEMLREAFEVRGLPLNKFYVKAVDHVVRKIGCVFAAVPLWY